MGELNVNANPNNVLNSHEVSFEERQRQLDEEETQEQEKIKREKQSPYTDFYQVNRENSIALRGLLKESPTALQILFFLFDHMDKYNAVVCSYKVLQEALGISSATVTRAVRQLKDKGFIYVYKTGTANVYVTNPKLVWNSWGTNLKYCEFPVNIVLSKSEQTNSEKGFFDKKMKTVEKRK